MAWRWLRAIQRRVRERADLAAECAALRHQVAILQRSRSRHLRFGAWDRLLWAFLSRYWPRWREALVLVEAETVLRWDRQRGGGMRLLPRFRRSRRGGRPRIDAEIRDLISRMARDNVLWGAPRIHGELLMLGFNVSQATVSRYLRRCVRPRSPGWRSFLRTQLFSNGLRQAIDEGEAITEWREAGPGSAAANDVRPAKWMGDRSAAERSARGSPGRCPPRYGRVNVQIHSLSERRPLHVRANVMIVLPLCLIGCPQPRAPPPCRSAGADEVLSRDTCFDGGDNLAGVFAPYERTRIGIWLGKETVDGSLKPDNGSNTPGRIASVTWLGGFHRQYVRMA
jgi:hypothetical protein